MSRAAKTLEAMRGKLADRRIEELETVARAGGKGGGMTRKSMPVEEPGRAKPSTRTIERFAKATGTRLRIAFKPDTAART